MLRKIISKSKRRWNSILLQRQLQADKRLRTLYCKETIRHIARHSANEKPMRAGAYCEIANFIVNSGRPDIAEDYYRLSLQHDFSPATFSVFLQCLLLNPHCTDEKMFVEAKKYNQFFTGIQAQQTHVNITDLNKKLNIGYICHFFNNSVSHSILNPFIQAHDREQVKIFCYSDTMPGEVADKTKAIADIWHDTKPLNDEALAALIQRDQIDILLELNGHCVMNRYGVIARKPAPIQISFYNIAATTGIHAIDYIMVGDEANLDQSQPFYTESIYYLKGSTGVALFAENRFPPCSPPPCLAQPYITFGSFGAAHKVNEYVVKLWCDVLKAVPNSRFYMKAGVLSHALNREAYRNLFHAQGIDLNRITFEGHSDHYHMLECYGKMDIALDTFPHSGGTTTMEAAWQGVPVISLYGEKYCSQNGKMILGCIGHFELIAYSEQEFVTKAVTLANDKARLIKYRQQLRENFRHSPRSDAKGFAAKLEIAYRDMWQRYCKNTLKNNQLLM